MLLGIWVQRGKVGRDVRCAYLARERRARRISNWRTIPKPDGGVSEETYFQSYDLFGYKVVHHHHHLDRTIKLTGKSSDVSIYLRVLLQDY